MNTMKIIWSVKKNPNKPITAFNSLKKNLHHSAWEKTSLLTQIPI